MHLKSIATVLTLTVAACLFTAAPVMAERVNRKAKARTLASVCTSNVVVKGGAYIYKQSAPLRAGGIHSPIVGFRKEPTLIGVTATTLRRSGANIYDSKGKKIGYCPWASAHDARGGRYRCTMQSSSLRRAAIKNTRSPKIFFQLNGAKKCAVIPDAGRCSGSVKGLCDRLIA